MDNAEKRSLLAIPIIFLVATGIALAGSQGGKEVSGIPVFALGVAIVFAIQWLAFIPAYLQQTEKFYDLTGSLTFITVTLTALALSPPVDVRAIILSAMVLIWAIRLGSFLFFRIRAAGEDRRFRQLKTSFSRFLLAWTLQGLWVTFTLAAALAALTSEVKIEVGGFALVGVVIWLIGFGIEVLSDWQKSQFKANTANKDRFIKSGLWAWSRHPNYFGEIMLWIGVAIVTIPILRGWQWLTMISPLFIILQLTRISGIPMLEARAEEKWGGQPDYEAYKASTPVLIPKPPKQEELRG
jgi:steroid 5-alpha reductase family enzyme